VKKGTHIFRTHNSNGTLPACWSREEQFYTPFYSNVMARDRFFHFHFENGDDPAKRDDPEYDRVSKIKKIVTLWTKTFCETSHSREAYNITHYNEKVAMDQSYLRKGDESIEKQTLDWNPQGPRSRRRPKQAWKRTLLEEAGKCGKTWSWRATESYRDASHMPHVPNGTKGYTTTTTTTTTTTNITTTIQQKFLLWTKWSCFTKEE
jgi:hypothetical protein